ncbi:damage-control phosphatase ARMT1 family protein [Methanobacterium alcaliphilum]|uniref:damage-control phosphatase ARMT1 family protein n=1 Tax=Methanobacterium alcaliphilum TaxID=392018 RepID=UPI00200AA14B|nr:ARMT1-like domain-containing protein [Methanobacterium alcaliphilum]MCK9152144.1 ARMT1-like domain-containing protein [Methanobacterium alcaliphilum]
MKVYYECAPCFLRQAKEALDLATDDLDLKIKIMEEIITFLGREFKEGAASNSMGTAMHRIIKKKTGNDDPYFLQKKKGNEIAERMLPVIIGILEKENTLENYIKAAIIGNLIDFAALGVDFDPLNIMESVMESPLVINDREELESALKSSKKVLYLADNTGEIMFDKLLIQKLKEYGVEIVVAVKEKPILNDACMVDAIEVGLDDSAEIITTGTDSVGVIYDELSAEFKEIFDHAELIIAKGLGNYEGLTEIDLGQTPVFCLLNTKCSATARDIGVKEKSNILLKIN